MALSFCRLAAPEALALVLGLESSVSSAEPEAGDAAAAKAEPDGAAQAPGQEYLVPAGG